LFKRLTKAAIAVIASLIALAFITMSGVLVWAKTGPRTLDKLLPYIEASLNQEGQPYHVTVGEAVLAWQDWSQPIDIQLRQVKINTLEKKQLLQLNDVSVGFSLGRLLRFKLVPNAVVIRKPLIKLHKDEHGAFFLGVGKEGRQIAFAELFPQEAQDKPAPKFAVKASFIGAMEYIQVQDASLVLDIAGEATPFRAPDVDVYVTRTRKQTQAKLLLDVEYGDRVTHVDATVTQAKGSANLQSRVAFKDFWPPVLERFVPGEIAWEKLALPLSGVVTVQADRSGVVSAAQIDVTAEEGVITHETLFAEPFNVSGLQAKGVITKQGRHFDMEDVTIAFGETKAGVKGIAEKLPEGWVFDVQASAENMPANDLYKYWPITLAPTVREWVTGRIRDGVVPQATAKLKLRPEDLGKPFPESGLQAEIKGEGMTVQYLSSHPAVKAVNGTVTFTGKAMHITADAGKMLSGAVLKSGTVHIDELRKYRPHITITVETDAPAKDVATYLDIESLNYAKPLSLDPEVIDGAMSGELYFRLRLPSKTENTPEDMGLEFAINAQLKEVAPVSYTHLRAHETVLDLV